MAASARVPAREKRRVGRVRRAVQLGARLTGWREGRGTRSDNAVLSDTTHARHPRRFWIWKGRQSAEAHATAGVTRGAPGLDQFFHTHASLGAAHVGLAQHEPVQGAW